MALGRHGRVSKNEADSCAALDFPNNPDWWPILEMGTPRPRREGNMPSVMFLVDGRVRIIA